MVLLTFLSGLKMMITMSGLLDYLLAKLNAQTASTSCMTMRLLTIKSSAQHETKIVTRKSEINLLYLSMILLMKLFGKLNVLFANLIILMDVIMFKVITMQFYLLICS